MKKSSGGEKRWLEQWSINSFSNSNISAHIPHPKYFSRNGVAYPADLVMEMQTHSSRQLLTVESECTFLDRLSFGFSIMPLLDNAVNWTDKSAYNWFSTLGASGCVTTCILICFSKDLLLGIKWVCCFLSDAWVRTLFSKCLVWVNIWLFRPPAVVNDFRHNTHM